MRLTKRHVTCPGCSTSFTIRTYAATYSQRIFCRNCGVVIKLEDKPGRDSDNRKRSREQEKRAAKQYGGRVQPASGSMDHAKGDTREKGVLRGECKFTRAKSFSLKLEQLQKIEEEAVGDEVPFMEVEFQGTYPPKRFVVLSDWAFEYLLDKGGLRGDIND